MPSSFITSTTRLDDAELDELADAFTAHDHLISYPLARASPQWLAIDLHDGTGRTYTVTEDTPAQHRVRPEPPLRRWAARQALHTRPERLAELPETARRVAAADPNAQVRKWRPAGDRLAPSLFAT